MPRQKKVLSYADQQYKQDEDLYSSLAQAFENFKSERNASMGAWSTLVQELKGVTLTMINDREFCLSYHRIESGTIDDLAMNKDNGKKFLKEIEKELKKKFREVYGKALKFKKLKEDQTVEQYSRSYVDTSYLGAAYGRTIGKFLVRDSIFYEFGNEE